MMAGFSKPATRKAAANLGSWMSFGIMMVMAYHGTFSLLYPVSEGCVGIQYGIHHLHFRHHVQ